MPLVLRVVAPVGLSAWQPVLLAPELVDLSRWLAVWVLVAAMPLVTSRWLAAQAREVVLVALCPCSVALVTVARAAVCLLARLRVMWLVAT